MLYGRNDEKARITSLVAERDHWRSGAPCAARRRVGAVAEAAALLPADGPRTLQTGIEAESGIAYAA